MVSLSVSIFAQRQISFKYDKYLETLKPFPKAFCACLFTNSFSRALVKLCTSECDHQAGVTFTASRLRDFTECSFNMHV